MLLYRRLTGGSDLAGFWKTSPAELLAWAQVIGGQAMKNDWADVPDEGEVED